MSETPNNPGPENNHKSSDHLYLDQLRFDPELKKTFLNFFVTNFRVVILLIILLTTIGIFSYNQLPLESDPEVKIPIAVVITPYPGASPSDVEELVTKKIETKVAGLKDIKQITSNSANSISTITVEFDAKADLDDSLRKLRDEMNNVKTDLPDDANEPMVQEISVNDQPIFIASLTGPYDGFTLRSYAEDIQDELEKIPGVREVKISGGDVVEYEVAYDPQKLTFYGISPDQANQLIRAANVAIPSGIFEGSEYTYPVRSDARFFSVASLQNIPLTHNDQGGIIYLKDVAEVTEKAIDKTVYSRFSSHGSQPYDNISIQVIKKTGGSIVDTANAAKERIGELTGTLAPGLTYDVSIDQAELIDENFHQLVHDFTLTIILVFAVLFLIVGLKEALVAGLAVPLVFFATFAAMLVSGISLNFLSMFSLILALGLLVDDAIVVVSATKQYLKTGKFTPEEAVLLVLNDFKVVLTTTTLTTVWAFLPLLLSTGIMGEYIKSIPVTVSVTLIASLVIALIINHPLAAFLERIRLTKRMFILLNLLLFTAMAMLFFTGHFLGYAIGLIAAATIAYNIRWYLRSGRSKLTANKELVEREWRDDDLVKRKLREQGTHVDATLWERLLHGIVHFNAILPTYEKYLKRLLATKRRRWQSLAVVVILFIIAVAFPATGIVKNEFFPASDFDYLWVNIEAPTGLKLEETDKIVRQVETKLLAYPEIANFSTLVGVPGQGNSFTGSYSNPSHLASITLRLTDLEKRKIKSYDLATVMRQDLSDITGAKITVEVPASGPPAGAAFEARIIGDDLQVLDRIAHELKPYLESVPGVVNIDISLKDSPADYTFRLKPDRLELYNLNAAYVGSILRLAIAGTEVTTVIKEGDEIKVIATFAQDKLPDLAAIANLQLINLRKQPVFLKDVADITLQPSVEKITRIDQRRTVLLSSGVSGDTSATQVFQQFQNKVKDYELPSGYDIVYGGENEQNQESVTSILQAMVLSFLLIISTLIIQFNSFKKALIILITIPLALIGVFFGLAIARISLTFPGLIGILALFGIVVKNAIILVDKINLNLKSKIEFSAAVVDAGKSRLEAIFITSICTIIGIIPITLSNETWTALGGAIIFGLMLSSFLTLFVVPILFMTFIRPDERL